MPDYATALRDHVMLTCRSVDRILLQAYVPLLQTAGQVCRFLRDQRGYPIPSFAAFGKIGEAYVRQVHEFAARQGIPVVHLAEGTASAGPPAPTSRRLRPGAERARWR